MSLLSHFSSRKRPTEAGEPAAGQSAYEAKRSRNIAENQAALEALGLGARRSEAGTTSIAPARKLATIAKGKKSNATKPGPKHKLDPLSIWTKTATARPFAKQTTTSHRVRRISNHFVCETDVACKICSRTDDEAGNDILLCDGEGCTAAYHMRCLCPPLTRVPRKEWLCPACAPEPAPPRDTSPVRCRSPGSSSTTVARTTTPAHTTIILSSPTRSPSRTLTSRSPRLRGSPAVSRQEEQHDAMRERLAECERVLKSLRTELSLSSVPNRLLCREAQLQSIMGFVQQCFAAAKGAAMYISGSPGLGKSMTVREAYRKLTTNATGGAPPSSVVSCPHSCQNVTTTAAQRQARLLATNEAGPARVCFLNAFQLQTPTAIYGALLRELGVEQAFIDATTSPRQALQRFLVPDSETFVEERRDTLDKSSPVHKVRRLRASRVQRTEAAGRGSHDYRAQHTASGAALSTGRPQSSCGGEGTVVSGMCLVVIDELDQLLGGDHEALHALFEWAAAPSSKLILLGIANSLDLMQRFLPRLNSRGAVPQSLTFPPYSPEELTSILNQRVELATESRLKVACFDVQENIAQSSTTAPSAHHVGRPSASVVSSCAHLSRSGFSTEITEPQSVPIIEASALVFCARKVAAASGDARRALQVCSIAAELAAEDLRQSLRMQSSNNASHGGDVVRESPIWLRKPALRFQHMSLALASAFKSRAVALMESLPQHQQMLLCAMVLRGRRATTTIASNGQCTLADLHTSYMRLCISQRLPHLPANEVLAICHNMAASGVFGIGAISAQSVSRAHVARRSADLSTPVWLTVAEEDLKAATQELRLFRNLLGS